jgi:hypothetical protein
VLSGSRSHILYPFFQTYPISVLSLNSNYSPHNKDFELTLSMARNFAQPFGLAKFRAMPSALLQAESSAQVAVEAVEKG